MIWSHWLTKRLLNRSIGAPEVNQHLYPRHLTQDLDREDGRPMCENSEIVSEISDSLFA